MPWTDNISMNAVSRAFDTSFLPGTKHCPFFFFLHNHFSLLTLLLQGFRLAVVHKAKT